MDEKEYGVYIVHWRDGSQDILRGYSATDAFLRAGYGMSALAKVDWWEYAGEVKDE